MAMSVPMKEVHAWAEKYDAALRADDPRFQRSVLVIHEEGSVFAVMSAFLVEVGEWTVMFSEHQGFHVWCTEDLAGAVQFANRGAPDPVKLGDMPPPPKKPAKKATVKRKTCEKCSHDKHTGRCSAETYNGYSCRCNGG